MKQTSNRIFAVFLSAAIACAPLFAWPNAAEAKTIRPIVFPVIGAANFSNDWRAPRVGHLHQGNDVFGRKGQPLIAVADGTVRFVPYPQPSYGYMVSITDADGYEYWYLHMNNDTPGTDDGRGGGMHAYAPGIEQGAPVKAGQLIGWIGDSGNAERTPPHVHFELHEPDGDAINPYYTLQSARRISKVVPGDPLPGEIFPFGSFTGGASIAVGEIDPTVDGQELVIGAGPGGGPSVSVYAADRRRLFSFFAYPSSFRGGLDVATADVDGNGVDEIITAAGRGGSGEIHVYDAPGTLRDIIFPYRKFNGDVRVSAADLDGDGLDEIIAGPGRGGGPDIQIINGDGTPRRHFLAYAATFRGGVDVAGIDATDTAPGYVITAPSAGGGPHVKVFLPDGTLANQFFPYQKSFRGGVRVSAHLNAATGQPRIITIPGGSDDANIRTYAVDGTLQDVDTAYEEWWRGGYDIASGRDGSLYASITSPSRRTTVRTVQSGGYQPEPDEPWNWYGD